MKTLLVISDVHQQPFEPYHPSYYAMKDFASDFKPDITMILGDFLDLYYLSSFAEHDMEFDQSDALITDYKRMEQQLDFFQWISGRVMFRQGNHEHRLEREAQKRPRYKSILDLEKMLNLERRGIAYTREVDDPVRIGKLNLTHGWYHNKYHTNKSLDEYGGNILYGHVHHFQSQTKRLKAYDEIIGAWSNGCLTDLSPEYVKGKPTRHNNGFTVVYFDDDGNFTLYPVIMAHNRFIFGGKQYGNT